MNISIRVVPLSRDQTKPLFFLLAKEKDREYTTSINAKKKEKMVILPVPLQKRKVPETIELSSAYMGFLHVAWYNLAVQLYIAYEILNTFISTHYRGCI